jgi:putative transposase
MPQSLSLILVHIVFSTKNREPMLQMEIRERLFSFLGGIDRDCGSPMVDRGGVADHVHLLCSQSRTITAAKLVEELKKRSSLWLKSMGPAYSHFHWQAGYGAFSIGRSQQEVLSRYFAGQEAHHAKRDFKAEFRGLLRKYGVPYDERYVWD